MFNYNTEIKTKYLTSGRINAPILESSWGSLYNLLKIVLNEGFNIQTIISIVIDPSSRLVTVKLPIGHGYITNDVIAISGATQQEFNREFRIIDFKADEINFVAPEGTNISEVTTTSSITCKIAPLGYSIVYENSAEGVICFKNTSVQSPAILKVIDKVPPNGYTTTWSKFARVVAGQEIDTLGEFVDNKKTPYSTNYPNIEKTGNRVSGSTGIHGFAKWDYAIPNSYSWVEASTVYTSVAPWTIIGDSNTFYLFIKPLGYGLGNINSFGLFKAENSFETANVFLQARQGNSSADSSGGGYYNLERSSSSFPHFEGSWGNYILSNAHSAINPSTLYFYSGGLHLGSPTPWLSTSISPVHVVTGELLTSNISIRSDSVYRGEHRGIKILYGNINLPEGTMSQTDEIIIRARSPSQTNISSGSEAVPLLFSLKDWEQVP